MQQLDRNSGWYHSSCWHESHVWWDLIVRMGPNQLWAIVANGKHDDIEQPPMVKILKEQKNK